MTELRRIRSGARLLFAACIASGAIQCGVAIAGADSAAEASSAEGTSAAAETIQEVVVTARKRSENAQYVPEAMVVLDPTAIESLDIKQAGDIAKYFPNMGYRQDLSVTSTFISIRGITATRNTDPAVSLVVDGVQTTNSSAIRQDLTDVAQMEVLRGPQGSLYGRNAIAGAINVVTTMPTNVTEGRATLGFGNADSTDGSIAVSGPIIKDVLFFRASADYHDDDGDIRDPAVDNHTVNFKTDKVGKLRLVYKPTDGLVVDLKYDHDDYMGGAYYFDLTRPIGAPFPYSDPASNSNTFTFNPMSVPISVNYSTIEDTSLRVTDELPFATLSSVSAYSSVAERYGVPGEGIGGDQPGDLDFTPANIEATPQTYNVASWSEELRLTSNGSGPFRWVAGVYYLDLHRDDTLPFYLLNGTTDQSKWIIYYPLGTERNVKQYAGFAQLDYDITSKFTATLGIRYDSEHTDQFDKDNPAGGVRTADFELPQPKLSLSYKFEPGQMIYATASRGFRSGGFNTPRSIFDVVYSPEELWSYEAGYKGEWLGGVLRTNAAAFYEDIKDYQDFVFDGVNASQTIYNIPKSHIEGVELELAYEPVKRLVLSANMGAMQSKIEEFQYGPLFPDPLVNSQIVGHHLPGFSHWGAQLAADYSQPLQDNLTASAHVDYSLRGKNYWDVTNIDVEKNVALMAANFGLERDRLRVSVWGTNLLGTRYWSNWFNQQITGLPDVGYPAEPRRFGVRLTARF